KLPRTLGILPVRLAHLHISTAGLKDVPRGAWIAQFAFHRVPVWPDGGEARSRERRGRPRDRRGRSGGLPWGAHIVRNHAVGDIVRRLNNAEERALSLFRAEPRHRTLLGDESKASNPFPHPVEIAEVSLFEAGGHDKTLFLREHDIAVVSHGPDREQAQWPLDRFHPPVGGGVMRSEERRVGKEG